MVTRNEALKLALDWLELGTFVYPTTLSIAIKEALAQPEQEPFTYYDPVRDAIRPFKADGDIPLYTTPPKREWVGLTDEERAECWRSSAKQSAINIEAKLKELNK